jgi:outer membrane immunogenic protein
LVITYEDALVGFEVNYNHTSLNAVIGNSINAPPFLANTLTYTVNVLATSEKRITDFGTLRVRGGWEVGCFLPYGFIGFALARVDLTRSATVSYTAKDGSGAVVLSGSSPTQFDTRNGVVAYGAAAGLGIDVGLLPNWFLRGEWEFAQFAPIDHHLHAHINTVRTALGVKF